MDLRIILILSTLVAFAAGILTAPKADAADPDALYAQQAASTVHRLYGVPEFDEEAGKWVADQCSAVAVRPGVLLTARHCVDGAPDVVRTSYGTFKVIGGKVSNDNDVAVLYAPGVVCPCAVVDDSLLPAGTPLRIAGYPHGRWTPRVDATSQRYGTIGDAMQRYVGGVAAALFIALTPEQAAWTMLWFDPVLRGGHSGGGTFAFRWGRWVLVGINSVGIGAAGMEYVSGSVPARYATPLL